MGGARRRRILSGGAAAVPAAITLFNRPALASVGCTLSTVGSGAPSIIAQMEALCASPPNSWINNQQYWSGSPARAGVLPSSPLKDLFSGFRSGISIPADVSVISALSGTGNGKLTVTFEVGTGTETKTGTADVIGTAIAELAAAGLNAAYFGVATGALGKTGSFELSTASIVDQINAYFDNASDGAGADNQAKANNKATSFATNVRNYLLGTVYTANHRWPG